MSEIIKDFINCLVANMAMTELESLETKEADKILEYTKGCELIGVFSYQLNGWDCCIEKIEKLLTEKDKARIFLNDDTEDLDDTFLENYGLIFSEVLDLVALNTK